jgi:hypothetical protein
MYMRRTKGAKRDPVKQWALPDRVFFACGACHILAAAFLDAHPDEGFSPRWIRPVEGHPGHHIVAVREDGLAFDYHGYSKWTNLFTHMTRRARQWSPGWTATVVAVPVDVLLAGERSRGFEGLWLKGPGDFLLDPMPRACEYLRRFGQPARAVSEAGLTIR